MLPETATLDGAVPKRAEDYWLARQLSLSLYQIYTAIDHQPLLLLLLLLLLLFTHLATVDQTHNASISESHFHPPLPRTTNLI